MPARANRSAAVVRAKLDRLGEPHIAPFVALADGIARSRGLAPGEVPYPDPGFAGTRAEAFVLLKSPGPRATKEEGSGLLSVENDDPTAERGYREYERVGVAWDRVVHWNAVPWPTGRDRLTAADRRDARPWLPKALALVPDVKAVLLLGADARDAWARSGFADDRVEVIAAPMPSRLGLLRPGAEEELRRAFDDLAAVLG